MKLSRFLTLFFVRFFCFALGVSLLSACSRFDSQNSDGETPLCTQYAAATAYDDIGSGTPADPYIICTAAQFASIGKDSTSWSSSFSVADDITFTAYDGSTPALTIEPIGILDYVTPGNSIPFTGTFDGNNHTFANIEMTAVADQSVGLFGNTDGAEIKELSIFNANVTGENQAGVLVGYNFDTLITDIYVQGVVTATGQMVGGLIGVNDGTGAGSDASLLRVVAAVNVEGSDYVGGLVGFNDATLDGTANITDSSASGNVTQSTDGNYFGGFIGLSRADGGGSATIDESYSTGDVTLTGDGSYSSAFIGELSAEDVGTDVSLNYVYATGDIETPAEFATDGAVGGLIGHLECTESTCDITKGRYTGDILIPASAQDARSIGGLIGSAEILTATTMTISKCYYDGTMTLAGTGAEAIGGLLGAVFVGGTSTLDIEYCYSAANIAATTPDPTVGSVFGTELTGSLPTMTSVFFDGDLFATGTGTGNGTGFVSRTTAQMKLQSSYPAWNFTTDWQIVQTLTYPFLR